MEGCPAIVGLNEIAPALVKKLVDRLQRNDVNVGVFTHETNSLLWLTLR